MPLNDPTNPGGPNTPNNQDPAAQNDFINRVAAVSDNATLAADQAERLTQAYDKANDTLDTAAKLMKDRVNQQEKLNKFAKELGKMDSSRFKNAEHAQKYMKELVEMYKAAAKSTKTTAAEAALLNQRMKALEHTMGQLPKHGELLEGQMNQIAEHIDNAQRSAKGLVTAMAQLGRHSAALKGAVGILGAMGIGKGVAGNVERRLEQIQEIKQKVAESKELRAKAVQKHMTAKREKAIAQLSSDPANLDAAGKLDLKKPSVRRLLTEKMFGEGAKGKDARAFLRGEGAMAKGGEAGAGYSEAMQSGGGAIAKVMGGFEDGITTVVEAMEGFAVPLMLVVGVIYLLIEAFDSYVKQNKDMEAKLGKGGLFTGGDVGTAFNEARRTLTPGVGTGVPLGITFERNLALAGGMAQNYNIGGMMKAGQENVAGMLPGGGGALGGFAGGALGELQRTVFGGARAAGLTDEEGMQEVLKLIDQYGETLASTETFFVKLNKDTQAAGISTTKYLKIIDEVSGHFDRMNKSLEATTAMMRDLSRYGAVSGESLKDMMEFLSKGGATTPDKYAQRIFQESQKSPEMVTATQDAQQNLLKGYLGSVNDQVQRLNKGGAKLPGITEDDIKDIQKMAASGDVTGARNRIESIRAALQSSGMSDKLITGITGAIDKADAQLGQVHAAFGKTADERAARQGFVGDNAVAAASRNIASFSAMMKTAGIDMESVISGKGGTANEDLAAGLLQGIFEQTGISRDQFTQMAQTQAGNRIQDIKTTTDKGTQRDQAIAYIQEMIKAQRTGKLKTELKGMKFLDENGQETTDWTKANNVALLKILDSHRTEAASTKDTIEKVVKGISDTNDLGDDAYAKQIDDAKAIAERTQTVEDILKNTFAPMLQDLVSLVEYIANKMGFGLFHKDAAELSKDFAADSAALNETLKKTQDNAAGQEKHLADLRKEMKTGTLSDDARAALDKQINEAITKLSDTEKDLAALQSAKGQGRYSTEQQEKLVHDLMGKSADMADALTPEESKIRAGYKHDMTQEQRRMMEEAMPIGATAVQTPGSHAFQVQKGGNTYIFYSTDASMVTLPQGQATSVSGDKAPHTGSTQTTGH
jgi:hypothetical protein